MAVTLAFTEADIERAAGKASYDRGLGYLDQVEDLEIASTQITATVYGSAAYRVSLSVGDGELTATCTCPHGREGFFCKHCVATGLSVLELGEDLPRHIEATQAQRQKLGEWLESLSKAELLAELHALLDDDPDLRRRLELRAALADADALSVLHAVEELISLEGRGYVDYQEAFGYADDVRQAAAAIDGLIKAGEAERAVTVARAAIGMVTAAFASADDSSGSIGDAAYELLDVHLRACEAAPSEPEALGNYLADLLLADEYGYAPDLDDYADLLGDQGLATVRERIHAAYAANCGDWQARALMESLLKADGDTDALVALYAADLDAWGQNHLRIAEVLDQAGRGDEALAWAERGVGEAGQVRDDLVDYLAGRYASAGRAGDVLGLRRDRFAAVRALAHYRKLRDAAADAGCWPAEREAALASLRDDAARRTVPGAWGGGGPVLLDVLLDEGELDAAWDAAGTSSPSERQWLALADASAATRPADALAVYCRAIESMKQHTGDDTYRSIAHHLLSARACHDALGTPEKFRQYVALLRAEQKRKRNLMKILDQNGL